MVEWNARKRNTHCQEASDTRKGEKKHIKRFQRDEMKRNT